MLETVERSTTTDPALARRLERLGLTGHENQWTDRYLLCNNLVDPPTAKSRQKFEATSRFIRDLVAHRWAKTRRDREEANPKRIHYLSMEFLLGRTLRNNMMNLAAEPIVRRAMEQEGWDLEQLIEEEPDAGLGNGGLGRLAACFIDSLATLQYPAIGYGLRYEYGIFRQSIRDGWQVEQPDNWLRNTDPWEVVRPGKVYVVPLNAKFELQGVGDRASRGIAHPALLGIAYDRPVVGYGANCINTLRLWAAAAPESFDFAEFSHGDFAGAVIQNVAAESLTRVLYPDDSTEAGRALRFLQQYFMVSCSLQDIVSRFRKNDRSQLVRAAGPGRHPDERHASGPFRRRVDADSARPGASSPGIRPGTSPCARWPTPITHCFPRPWRDGRSSSSKCSFPGTWRSFTRSTAASSTTSAAAIPATRPRLQRVSLIEEGPVPQGPHGPSVGRRLAQHQRRGGNPLGSAPHARAARFRRDVPGAVQQQDQRRHAPALAAAGQPGPVAAHHQGDRRRLGHRHGATPQSAASGRRRGLPRAVPRRQARGQGGVRQLAQGHARPGRGPRHDLRQPDQTHPRVQTATAQRPAHHRSLQPAARTTPIWT